MIGIGNDLRCDDAAGRLVAARVQRLGLPGVRVRSVCQLVPELVEELATCAHLVFVDADPDSAVVSVRPISAQPVAVGGARASMTHHPTAAGLLRLAQTAGVPVPTAVMVGVPARELGLGTCLSTEAADGVEAAIAVVADLARCGCPKLGFGR